VLCRDDAVHLLDRAVAVEEGWPQSGVTAEIIAILQIVLCRDDAVHLFNRVVAVEEGWPQSGVTAEIIATINEECFDDLDAPPERITGAEV
jgi:pyruvate dehydrogenase E1 component beta subunit